jgi:hypothetical protein
MNATTKTEIESEAIKYCTPALLGQRLAKLGVTDPAKLGVTDAATMTAYCNRIRARAVEIAMGMTPSQMAAELRHCNTPAMCGVRDAIAESAAAIINA